MPAASSSRAGLILIPLSDTVFLCAPLMGAAHILPYPGNSRHRRGEAVPLPYPAF